MNLDKDYKELEVLNYYNSVGLSRLTISNDHWHESNEIACHDLFGFSSWKEFKVHHRIFFPDAKIVTNIDNCSTSITFFEKSLMYLMTRICKVKESQLAQIFSDSESNIHVYLEEIRPKWENVEAMLGGVINPNDWTPANIPAMEAYPFKL